MLKISHIVLPEPSPSEQVFLGSLLQSARWLGWEMPKSQQPAKPAVEAASSDETTEPFVSLPVQGKPA